MPAIKVLSITDLHFNPCYDFTLIPKLEKSAVNQWESIFQSSQITACSVYGEDTNYPLLISFFKQVQSLGKVSFVMFSGDFLGHHLRSLYEKGSNDMSKNGYESFITKTFEFLVMLFKRYLPNTLIYPTLGNDDNFDGDYKIAAQGAFLSMVQNNWQSILTLPETFKEAGFYSMPINALENTTLLSLNNIFMSGSYNVNNPINAAQVQLDWLKQELQACKGENVWLMFHEPLGINIFPTIKENDYANPHDVEMFLKNEYYQELLNILTSYSEEIKIIFSGHTHKDSFRVLQNTEKEPLLYSHITPSISPIFGNNAGFQLFFVDAQSAIVQDYETYALNVSNKEASWQCEYRFSTTYKQPNITPQSMQALWDSLATEPSMKEAYKNFYCVGHTPIKEEDWKVYYEAINHLNAQSFSSTFKPS